MLRELTFPPRRFASARQLLVATAVTTLAGVALTASLAQDVDAQAMQPALLERTPLILKDGRIANVSIHVIPFEPASEGLSEEISLAFDEKLEMIATDCFLTAQAIGHVEPGSEQEGDTLTAHRLARARSDVILKQMAEAGLSQASIASVWDWQFIVREPRVTLWVFELRKGEDCSGDPIDASAKMASLDDQIATGSIAQVSQAQAEKAMAKSENNKTEKPEPIQSPEPIAAAETSEPEPIAAIETPPAPNETPKPVQSVDTMPEPEVVTEDTAVFAPLMPLPLEENAEREEAVEPEPMVKPVDTEMASNIDDVQDITPVIDTDAPAIGKTEADRDELAITFAINSSYLPQGASRQIRELLAQVGKGNYTAELVASVGTGDVDGADPEEALRYNRWMADRRIGRVQEQIDKSADLPFTFSQDYRENDPSRQVIIRLTRLP